MMKIQYLLKLTGLLLLSLWLVSNCWAFTGAPKDDANCQGAWLFTEGSGTTVADSSQNNNIMNCDSSGNPTWASISGTGAPDYVDYMMDFTTDTLSAADDASLDFTTEFSLTTWVYIDSLPGYDLPVFFGKTQWWDYADCYRFYASAYYQKIYGGIKKADTTTCTISGSVTITTENWHFLVLTKNASVFKLYMEGVEDTGAAQSGTMGDVRVNTSVLRIGMDVNMSYLDGKFTESAAFSDVLDSTEINDIMDNGLAGSAPPPARRFFLVN